MADTILSAGTRVDLSGIQSLRAELAILQATYSAVSGDIRQSVNRVVDAERQATEAIAAGHTKLASVLQSAANSERASLDSLIAKQIEVKNTMEEIAGSSGHAVSEIQAVSGTIRTLDGNGGIRAAERFLTMIPGLAPALQAAFPVVGALAFGKVLLETIDKFGKASEAEKKFAEDNKKLDTEMTSLEGHIQSLNVELQKLTFNAAAGEKLKGIYDQQQADADMDHLKATERQIKFIQQEINQAQSVAAIGGKFITKHWLGMDVDELKNQLSLAQKEIDKTQEEIVLDNKKAEVAKAQQAKDAIEESKKANEKKLEEAKKSFTELSEERDKALKFIKDRDLNLFEFYAEEFRAQEEADRKAEAEQKRHDEALARQFDEEMKVIVDNAKQAAEVKKQAIQDANSAASEARSRTETSGSISGDNLEAQRSRVESASKVSGKGGGSAQSEVNYLEQLRVIDAEIIQEKWNTASKILAIDQAAAAEDPSKENLNRVQSDIAKLAAIQREGASKMATDNAAILNVEQEQYKKFFDKINQEATKAFNDLLQHPKKFTQDLNNIWQGMVTSFADYLLKLGLKWVEKIALQEAQELGLNAVLQALHLTAAASQQATTAAANSLSAQSAAALAATNTFAWYSAVDPLIAPEMAAIAYAEAETLAAPAALETGTNYVPKGGLYELHQGEAVVPKPFNPAAGGTGVGNTFNVTQHINGGVQHSPGQIADMAVQKLQSFARRSNMRMA